METCPDYGGTIPPKGFIIAQRTRPWRPFPSAGEAGRVISPLWSSVVKLWSSPIVVRVVPVTVAKRFGPRKRSQSGWKTHKVFVVKSSGTVVKALIPPPKGRKKMVQN